MQNETERAMKETTQNTLWIVGAIIWLSCIAFATFAMFHYGSHVWYHNPDHLICVKLARICFIIGAIPIWLIMGAGAHGDRR